MIIPVILSGGNGTRLWPLSRKSKPKQFIDFTEGKTMFSETINRFVDKKVFSTPIISGNINHEDLIDIELEKNNITSSTVILEPIVKSTAPAIAAVIEYLHVNGKDDEVVVFLASDAYIGNTKTFQKYLEEGREYAESGKVVCFGIKPLYPEIGYGYIKLDKKIKNNGYKVDRFVEKPQLGKAIEFVKDGNYLWNSGIFMTKVSTMRQLFLDFQKNLYKNIENTIKNSVIKNNKLFLNKEIFEKSDEISIDYAIIENLDSKTLVVVSMDIVWSDLGSFKSLYDVNDKKTSEGNVVIGNIILNNTDGCFIKSSEKIICCSDISNLVIIEENDAILIMNKNESQNVKKIIEKIKNSDIKDIL